jgi:hypothetical protein
MLRSGQEALDVGLAVGIPSADLRLTDSDVAHEPPRRPAARDPAQGFTLPHQDHRPSD